MTTEIVFVSDLDNDILVSSRMIAEKFEKEHRNVLASIRELVSALDYEEISEVGGVLKIQQSSYVNEQGKRMPEFMLNRDAFSILAMGFTGTKALKWKIVFLRAFEEALGSITKLRADNARKEKVIQRLQKKKAPKRWLVPDSSQPHFEGFEPPLVSKPETEMSLEETKAAKRDHVVKTLSGIVKKHILEVTAQEKADIICMFVKGFLA